MGHITDTSDPYTNKPLPIGPQFMPKVRKRTESRARMIAKRLKKRRTKNKRAKKARRINRRQ